MSVEKYYENLIATQPVLGKCIIKQMLYWPTSSNNIQNNCSLFEKLNPDGLIIPGLDENNDYYNLCSEYAFIILALKQRGIMNMTYYLLLDELINDYNVKGGKKDKQHGGVNLKELIKIIFLGFTLLGSSEGIETDAHAITSGNAQDVSVFKSTIPPVTNIGELQGYRQQKAEDQLRSLMDRPPWVLPEIEITIVEGITEDQMNYITGEIQTLNTRLQSLSRDASKMCSEIGSSLDERRIFSSDAFYQSVYKKAEDLESEQSTKRVASQAQDTISYLSKGFGQVASSSYRGLFTGESSPERPIDKQQIVTDAFKIVVGDVNNAFVSQTESFILSQQYQALCRTGTPSPKFVINTQSENGVYSIKMQTKFGNNNTGNLLLAHLSLIQRIEAKMIQVGENSKEYMPLQSFKERIIMERKLIESSVLFLPLDFISGVEGIQSTIVESTIATSKFDDLVSKISEYLPITDEDIKMQHDINKKIREQSRLKGKEFIDTWTTYISIATKGGTSILTDAVKNTGELVGGIIGSASTLTNVAIVEATNVGENLAKGATSIGIQGAKGATDIGIQGAKGIGAIIDELALPVVKLLGVFGLAAFIAVWFKKSMLTSSNSSSSSSGRSSSNGNGNNQGQPVAGAAEPYCPLPGAQNLDINDIDGGRKTRKVSKLKRKILKNKTKKRISKNKTKKRILKVRRRRITKHRK